MMLDVSLSPSKIPKSLFTRCGFVFLDCQAIDTQKSRDPVDDQKSPMHVGDKSESQVSTQIPELESGINLGQPNPRKIRENRAADERG